MKKKLFFLILLSILFPFFSEENSTMSRLYVVKIIAFNVMTDVYCSFEPIGYYKYPQKIKEKTVYLTYEANNFFKQSAFDENFLVFASFIPSNMWSNKDGSVVNLKKNYSPVIEKNRIRKKYPFGFGKN